MASLPARPQAPTTQRADAPARAPTTVNAPIRPAEPVAIAPASMTAPAMQPLLPPQPAAQPAQNQAAPVAADGHAAKPGQPAGAASAPAQPVNAVPATAAAADIPPAPIVADPAPVAATRQPAAPAPLVEQIGTVAVTLARSTGGDRQLTIRLDPPQLGQVQVAISQPRSGAVTAVTLTVERPETLLMVLRDEPALHRALDRAGVPADGRTVTFQLAPPHEASPAPSPQPHGSAGGPGLPDMAAREQGQGQPRQSPSAPTTYSGRRADADEPAETASAPTQPRWRYAGIDITA